MDSIRILHASDLHIAEIPNLKSPIDRLSVLTMLRAFRYRAVASSYDPSILKAFCNFVLAQEDLNAVVLTGDLATTGDYQDVTRAYQILRGPASCVHIGRPYEFCPEGSLEGLKSHLFLIPGNHDRYKKSRRLFFQPGARVFHDVFSDYWDADVREFQPLGDEDLSVSLIGVDFSLRRARDSGPSPLNKFAQGKVYRDILDELVDRTTRIRQQADVERLVILWVMHFPPLFPGQSPLMKLIGSSKIIKAANKCGVMAILSGHTHDQLTYRYPHMNFPVYCAGTATEFQSRVAQRFQIIEISNGMRYPEIKIEHYGFDRLFGKFKRIEV